jgi:hypothetical protein
MWNTAINFAPNTRKGMMAEKDSGYYTPQRDKLIATFEKQMRPMVLKLAGKYGREGADELFQDAVHAYGEIIPLIPNIGGKANPYTRFLFQSAWGVAIYRAVVKHGGTVEGAAEMLHRGAISMFERTPAFLLRLFGKWYHSRLRYPKMRKEAQKTQEREYSGDWVYEFVEGDGENFDYGLEMTECGIIKFLTTLGADELIPYMCAIDYISLGAMRVELRRTKTLAFGCDSCDFRFIANGNPPIVEWPPRFYEKDCGERVHCT